ncbi:MAG: hypothetical protein OEY56_11705, partial [Cyclobacteriaceae bacterium]|nr:hypothetical protein [Cyclobacteriaceae bacterium]
MLLRSAKYFILSLFSLSGLLSCSKYLEESDHMALINEAGALLYLSKVAEAANLLNQVDTTQLDDREKALFLLGKGFCSHLNGANEPASVYVHRAQHALMKHGYDADQAEGFLVNGLILESVEWNVAASKHFQKALDLLRDQADTDAYFYALLGAMRTSRDGAKFIGEANTCLERNRNKEKQASLLTSRAMLSTDPAEKLALYLLAYEYYDEHSPLMSRIGNLTRIATTYQATGEMDSAFAYLDRLKSLIRANGSDVNHLLKYHLLKAQFENSRKNQEAALTSLAYIFEHSPVGSNMAGNAYQLRAAIYYELGDFEAAHTDLQQHTAFVIKANEESLRL